MAALPTGRITFLFTDVEGNARRWLRQPEAARAAADAEGRSMTIDGAVRHALAGGPESV